MILLYNCLRIFSLLTFPLLDVCSNDIQHEHISFYLYTKFIEVTFRERNKPEDYVNFAYIILLFVLRSWYSREKDYLVDNSESLLRELAVRVQMAKDKRSFPYFSS